VNTSRQERVFQGNGVSPGIVLGHALKLDSRNRVLLKLYIEDDRVEAEVLRLERAVSTSREQLEQLKARLAEKIGPEHGFILDVHLLMLEDKSLISEIVSTIRTTHANAEWAVRQVTNKIRDAYASLEDEYFRDRGIEIENVVERILWNLSGDKPLTWAGVPADLIVVSHDFNPSSFAVMDLQKVRGLALESGGRTSHTAIIARSMRLPAVMGIRDFLSTICTGDLLLLDGDEGRLVVHPTAGRLDAVRERLERFLAMGEASAQGGSGATVTSDGIRITLRANTDLPHEVRAAKRCGAEGIGLFRSEFLFFAYPHGMPGTEAQLETYRMLAQEMSPHPVSVRTLDTGSDRTLADGSASAPELNANMGLRGIRLSLVEKKAFCDQIEAVLRASNSGRMEIVLPMVTTIDEIRQAKDLIEQVRLRVLPDLDRNAGAVPIGVMIEVPAAVLALESIAREVDFLCVGTNDLIQYVLAVDRGNPQVSHLFQPLNPSVLYCLKRIADVCRGMKMPVRVCGEMSSNPFFVVLLIGLGFTDLSMNAFSIPTIRRVVQEVSLEKAQKITSGALAFSSTRDIAAYLIDAVTGTVQTDLSAYVKEIRTPNGRENMPSAS